MWLCQDFAPFLIALHFHTFMASFVFSLQATKRRKKVHGKMRNGEMWEKKWLEDNKNHKLLTFGV